MSLTLQGVTVTFGDAAAVAGIDLSIGTGERFAIMGPSGSGKSTLLRTIAGLTATDSGTIAIDGRDVGGVPAHRRSVGLMFQDYALFPHMTVLGNVSYGLRMSGTPEPQRSRRSHELLDLVGLSGLADRRPETLSGGEQQRVALARTLAPAPSVVLLDEPLGSLDVSLRESLLAETRSILDQVGATSVYVTHDRGEAFAFADRLAILNYGRLARVGTPDEIWHDPRSVFVARAIGQSNLVPHDSVGGSTRHPWFIPRTAVRLEPSGPFSGVVDRAHFADGDHILTLALADGSLVEVASPTAPSEGSTVRFAIDFDAAIQVSLDEI